MNLLQKTFLWKYAKVNFALLLTFWFLSLSEIFIKFNDETTIIIILKTIAFKLLNDFFTIVLIGLFLYPIYYLLNLGKKKYGNSFFLIIGGVLVLVQLSLIKYSVTTLLNLGADLLGYSFDDMFLTVSSSESFSILSLLPFLLLPLLFVVLRYFFIKKIPNSWFKRTAIVLLIIVLPLKFLVSDFNDAKYQNKFYFLAADIVEFKLNKLEADNFTVTDENEYPLLKSSEKTKDVLQPFFNIQSNKKPNIVIVMLEGLGSEFVDGNGYSGFSPFIDQLIDKSLYWENFVSTTGRTFGVLPSLLGSLPFGDTGFLEIPNTPTHVSLFSVLKENDYTTSFYSGSQSSFDNIINFLEYNDVDFVVDENKYGKDYKKVAANSGGFSWGYPDGELFRKTLSTLDGKKEPRLDVLMTLSNHEPFTIPEKNKYTAKVDSILNSGKRLKISSGDVTNHKNIFATLIYVDESLEKFMKAYEKRADYNNTIFVFTGDHRLIPIEQKDKLCRFHVPLIIYSSMLKKPERFASISSHWDVAPSLVSFLSNNYNIETLENTAWMSSGLDTARHFRNIHEIGLMRYKGGLKDFIYKDYLYNSGNLYKIDKSFSVKRVYDKSLLKTVENSFSNFKKINGYISSKDKIYPASVRSKMKTLKVQFTEEELKYIKEVVGEKNMDEIFLIAREKAFNSERENARLLCNYILNTFPNHTDARVLKGRTLSWEGKYEAAEKEFLSAIKRHPFYDDPYAAILDLYWWSDQDGKSIEIGKKALKNEIKNPEISFKLAKAYERLNQKTMSMKIMDSILKIHPKNKNYLDYKKTLK